MLPCKQFEASNWSSMHRWYGYQRLMFGQNAIILLSTIHADGFLLCSAGLLWRSGQQHHCLGFTERGAVHEPHWAHRQHHRPFIESRWHSFAE